MSLPNISLHSWHNASIAVELDGEIITVVEFERFINQKNASHCFFLPVHVQDFVLKEIYDYIKLNFGFDFYENFIISYGFSEFPEEWKKAIPANNYLIKEGHHTAHASSSFYQSSFEESLVISFDGGSNDGHFNFYHAKKGEELNLIQSIGMDLGSHYQLIGMFCEDVKNYNNLTSAGKVLGLQSYGNVREEWLNPLIDWFKTPVPFWHELEERKSRLSENIGIPFSEHNKLKGQEQYDFARTAQEAFEKVFFEISDPLIMDYNLPVILTGGCALNIVLNTKVKEKYPNLDIFISPNSSDCGLSVGALCDFVKPKNPIDITYSGVNILDRSLLMEYANLHQASKVEIDAVVDDLYSEKILGLMQGNSEHGPRALGNRSILCSPLPLNMKDVLNDKVKHREWFRPFAPIVRLEDVSEYFHWEGESRWMNFCPKVKSEWVDKLPAITHIDGTARVQTITREQNELVYGILTKFKEKSGVGVLVNTSFNVDGKPILSSIKDALDVFQNTLLDRLYIEGYYFTKP